MKAGVVGVGVMGEHHARVYSEMSGCELIGVMDTDLARAREIAGKYHTKVVSSIEEMLSLKPDAVSIVVPTSLHREVAIKFLRKGISCFVEKPIAPTVEAAKEIIAEAEKSGAILMVGHIERFNPAVLKFKEILDSQELGKLLVVSTRRVGPIPPRIRDVGIIIDSATPDIDVTRFLFGREPERVCAKYGNNKLPNEDYAVLLLDFGDGIANIEVNWFTPIKIRTLVATATGGLANLNYIDQTLEVLTGTTKRMVEVNKREPLKVELEHFVECVVHKKKPIVDGVEGMRNLEVALKALREGGQ